MKFPKRLGLIFCSLCLFLTTSGTLAQEAQETPSASAWQELPSPDVGTGMIREPKLLSVGSKFHLVWAGTTSQIRNPELMHSTISGGDDEWKSPRAPFFGQNKGRVRKVSIGKTRNLMAVLFQRSLRQGNDAYEVLLTFSSDQGWSWSSTIEIDSYVADKTGGTTVSVAGRQGSNRPEFAMAWAREFGNIRAANFDINSSLRPEGTLIGEHTPDAPKAEVGALGRNGFSVVFNNGVGLATAHVKALIGKIEEGSVFLRGRFGDFFAVASLPSGPSRLAVGTGRTIEAFTSNELSWKNDSQAGTLPFDASGITIEADMDERKNLHVVMVRTVGKKVELWYIGQRDKRWGEAELVHAYDKETTIHGFDIAATKDYALIAASEGFKAKFFRRRLKKK